MIKINITSTVFTPFVKEADPNITVMQLIEQLKQHYGQPITTKFDGKFFLPMDMQKKLSMIFQDGCSLEVNKGFSMQIPQPGLNPGSTPQIVNQPIQINPTPQQIPQQLNIPPGQQPIQLTPQRFVPPQINPIQQPQGFATQPMDQQGVRTFQTMMPQGQFPNVQIQQQGQGPNQTMTPIATMQPNTSIIGQAIIRPQISNVQINQTNKELEQAKTKITQQEEQITELEQEIEKLKKEIQRLKAQLDDYEEAQKKIRNLQNELEDAEDSQSRLRRQLAEIEELKKRIKTLEGEKEELAQDLEARSQQLRKARESNGNSQTGDYDKQQLLDEIDSLKHKNARLLTQNEQLRQRENQGGPQVDLDEITEYQTQIENLQKEKDIEHKNFLSALDEKTELNRKIIILDSQIKEKDQSIDTQTKLRLKHQSQSDQLTKQLKDIQDDLEISKQMITVLQGEMKTLQSKVTVDYKPDNSKLEALQAQREQKQRERQLEEQKLKADEERKLQEVKHKQWVRDQAIDQNLNKTKEERNNLAKGLKDKFKNSHGVMETCFLVDVTGSMDPFKEQTRQSVNGSMAKIKEATGRDSNWACIAYQDKAEFKSRGNKYQQIDFTNKPNEITQFLAEVKCEGGGDVAEDLQGGMEQMLKLTWTKQFRMCICITDSPCHGKLYNSGCSDNHKDDDIKPTIEKLADQDILLIGINFTENTRIMYQKITDIYKSKNKGEMCIIVNMDKIAQGAIWQEMVKLITEGAAGATQTNKSATKSKGQGPAVVKTKDGAMESLCKQGNFMEFQNSVPVVDCSLDVFRVELQEQAFEDNIEKIHKIQSKFYQPFKEGKWDCTRTAKPFAFGMMKAVYLMKKRNDTSKQLYVIKMPLDGTVYATLDQAIQECRSHLICKQLMRKFMRTLREETQKQGKAVNYPDIQYSDFLILKEMQGAKEVFWIAERFFQGDFRKYNNNNGYINDATDIHNRLSQAFTYYSYWVSNFDFMVNDVQGVSNYFTDPALNTNNGNFDDTDMGADGQAMFMVNFEAKKDLCKDILDTLGIYPNE